MTENGTGFGSDTNPHPARVIRPSNQNSSLHAWCSRLRELAGNDEKEGIGAHHNTSNTAVRIMVSSVAVLDPRLLIVRAWGVPGADLG